MCDGGIQSINLTALKSQLHQSQYHQIVVKRIVLGHQPDHGQHVTEIRSSRMCGRRKSFLFFFAGSIAFLMRSRRPK
jgi:hypothetical protein